MSILDQVILFSLALTVGYFFFRRWTQIRVGDVAPVEVFTPEIQDQLLNKGRCRILFWADWSFSCEESLNRSYDIPTYAVNYGDSDADFDGRIKNYIEREDIKFIRNRDLRVSDAFKVTTIPVEFIVEAGLIRHIQ